MFVPFHLCWFLWLEIAAAESAMFFFISLSKNQDLSDFAENQSMWLPLKSHNQLTSFEQPNTFQRYHRHRMWLLMTNLAFSSEISITIHSRNERPK